jgi:predicted enzyme related to lactoylglutathione lyase
MAKKKATKKTATKKTAAKKKAAARKKAPARKKRVSKKTEGADPRLNGWITHTEFASSNPEALKTWCKNVLGWKIKSSVPMPDGSEYILFHYSDKAGGGIRPTAPGEAENTIPYVQVTNVHKTFEKAISGGATQMMPPERIMPNLVIAIVRAPGGIVVGFAGPK